MNDRHADCACKPIEPAAPPYDRRLPVQAQHLWNPSDGAAASPNRCIHSVNTDNVFSFEIKIAHFLADRLGWCECADKFDDSNVLEMLTFKAE